jgi:hypothetical protein
VNRYLHVLAHTHTHTHTHIQRNKRLTNCKLTSLLNAISKSCTKIYARQLHHMHAEQPNQIIIGSFPLGVVNRGAVDIPLWYIGLLGVPRAVRCMGPGSLDEGFWPATFFRGGFIGVSRCCGAFGILGRNSFEGVLDGVLAGVLRSRRQWPGTTELLHVPSWFSTSKWSYNKYHSI